MSTSTLQWLTILLAGTQLFPSYKNNCSPIIQWHSAGATLYILISHKIEMDLRLEREIIDIQVFLSLPHN
jgi:hypothetical protein